MFNYNVFFFIIIIVLNYKIIIENVWLCLERRKPARETERERVKMDLSFKTAFFNDDGFMKLLQARIFLLKFLVLPAGTAVLKPDGDLARIEP